MADAELARLERRYREVKSRLQELGFAIAGSVIERHTVCGADNCRCQADPPQRHGPYFQYSRKVAGKTISRRLNAEQAQRYRDLIANRRTLDQITADMDELSYQAAELLARPTP